MRRSTRKRNPPARLEDDDEPPPRKRQPQKRSQPPTAHKVHTPPRGPTQQHGLHSSATASPNSHTSTSRAPTLPARARTSSPVTAIPQQADMAQQCLKQDIQLTNRQDKMRRSTRKWKPPVRPEHHDKTTLRKRQPQAMQPHRAQIIQRETKRQCWSPSVATSSSRPPTPPTRAPTPPHVISITPQVEMAQQLLEQNILLVNEQGKKQSILNVIALLRECTPKKVKERIHIFLLWSWLHCWTDITIATFHITTKEKKHLINQ
ncbi:serine/arginine repetitive matrix protein 1-like [Ruditapes philippinarum]|uniref:serine/arginine repetitive matrix protein 1-like n=1 Tax=Ruditapes philippinarum TaxID=129788 RepID=UPI00295A77E6|nr:serine/arginine repetitive matrix protein 1-like [Ruditapes philippinarum]